MSNNKQSSVEFFKTQIVDIIEDYKDDIINLDEYIEHMKKVEEQAKAMHKQEIMKAINEVSENNVKYANMIITSYSQIEGELFMHNTKLAEQYYNETFGGNK